MSGSSKRCLGLASFALGLFLFIGAGCDDSQRPSPEPTPGGHYDGAYDAAGGTLELQLETPTGSVSPFQLLAGDILWAPGSGILSANVAIRNAGTVAMRGPDGVAVSDFLPQHVAPLNADCAQIPNAPPMCVFDHRGSYGEDGILNPGETSQPVLWSFQDTPGVSFAFRAQLVPELPQRGGLIAGVVYHDLNRNGVRNSGEPGLAGFTVNLLVSNNSDPVELIQRTDAQGRYSFRVSRPGVYPLRKPPARGWEATTPDEMHVFVVEGPDGVLSDFTQGDFGCASLLGDVIEGSVFVDRNRNGARDPDESGIAAVEVSAWGLECNDPRAARVETDSDGRYHIEAQAIACLPPWFVQRAQVDGMIGTTPKETRLGGIPNNDFSYVVDFGLAPVETEPPPVLLTIVGSVYYDLDLNGQRDPNEPGVANVPLSLLSPCDLPTLPTFTNPVGEYRFEPSETSFCPIVGVHRGRPELVGTTANPVEIMPPTVPGYHEMQIDFGVRTPDNESVR